MKVYGTIRYDRVREIGIGQGMNSTVYLARDPSINRELAVKEIDRLRITASRWDEYYREAQAMFASRHDHVVPIYYACMTAHHISLAMPYYRRGSLLDRIRNAPVPLREAYRIADGILSALAQIHVANLLHFDLKPSNVLFSDRDAPLVSDFGQARMMDPSGLSTAPRMYRLTIPPEVFGRGIGTVESDVYHAGLTLYRTFNGDAFFQDQIGRLRRPLIDSITSGRLPNRDRFLPHVPGGIRRVIRRALRVDPGERYHSATEFQDALGRVEVPLDWRTEPRANGGFVWRCQRHGQPGLEVQQLPHGNPGRWTVEVYTRRGRQRRRKGLQSMWARGLSSPDADRHLRTVFSALESG